MQVRNFTSGQLPALLDFVEQCNLWGNRGRELGRQTFREVLGQPGLAPTNNCFLLNEGGRVRGFCLVIPELPIDRTVLELEVAPGLAGSTAERELVCQAVHRARELGARIAHLCLPNPSPRSRLLAEEGFSTIRTYWEMVWRQETLPAAALPEGFTVRPYRPGDAPVLTEVQNAAFDGSWGFCPNTVEQIGYRAAMVHIPREGILFLCHGEKTAGYCWTCLAPVEGAIRGVIGMIGLVPAYRGQGVSRCVLVAGMEFLRSLDVADIRLQVDGSNDPAIRLYTAVGFEKASERHWFERGFSSGTTPHR